MSNPFSKTVSTRDFASAGRSLSDGVLQSAEEAVETTRDFTDHALDKAEQGVRKIRRNMEPGIDELAGKAQDFARRGKLLANDAGTKAQQTFLQCADATSKYVAEQPVKSVLIAAAAGAVLAALLSSRSRRPQA